MRRPGVGIGRRHLRGFGASGSAAPAGDPAYIATGFSDANYFIGAAAQGHGGGGTFRWFGKMTDVIPLGTKIFAGRCDAGGGSRGWYLGTGLTSPGSIALVAAGCGTKISPLFIPSPSDVGLLMLIHGTIDASFCRLYINGLEIGSGTVTGVPCTPALDAEVMTLGRHSGAGLAAPHMGCIAFSTTSTVLTAGEIATDAATIMATTSRFTIPDLPSQDVYYNAADIVSVTNWADRAGNDATLTRNGTITVTEVT